MASKEGAATFDVEEVRRRLAQLGSTQSMLASYLKVDTSAVSKALAGKRKFSPYEQTLVTRYLKELEADIDDKGLRTRRVRDVGRVEKLKYFMNLLGIDEYRLGRSSGIEARDIKRILLHVGPPMSDEMARDLSAALGMDLDDPRPGGRQEPRHSETIAVYAPPTQIRDFPQSLIEETDHEHRHPMFDYMLMPAGSIEPPPLLRGVPGALAMYSPDFGFETRWRSGDILFMHPRMPLMENVDVMIVFEEQFISFGSIEAMDADMLQLRIGKSLPTRFQRSRLTAIYKIAGAWFR